MPVERNDNTRVNKPKPMKPPLKRTQNPIPTNQAQLWDADKVKKYRDAQDFYNYNAWGYGISGVQTNYDPHTVQGQQAIQSNFDYAKSNVQNFGETLITTGAAEGAGALFRWATTPTKIGEGAEAIVSSAPASTRVTKVTTIPRSEMHVRNTVPGAAKAKHVGSSNGLHTYTQQKVKILSPEQLQRASGQLDKLMKKAGWRKVTHPNLQGAGYTNGRYVVSDLGPGNVGKNWLGSLRLTDFSMDLVPQFRMAIQRKGGVLK